MFQVEPRDLTVRSGVDVELRCQATGEPVPTVQWLRAGRPLQAGRRLRTLADGSLWLERVEAGDAGVYECVAHNLLGSATTRALLAVRGKQCPCPGLQQSLDHSPQVPQLLVITEGEPAGKPMYTILSEETEPHKG